MEKNKKIARWVLAGACIMILFLLAMVCLDICLDGVGFSRESIAERLAIVGPMLVTCLVIGLLAFFIARGDDGDKGGKGQYKAGKEGKNSGKIRGIFLCLALVFIALGILNGGARDVFVKAVNICTECIGLG